VQVANTDGEGAFLRRTPNTQDRLAAYPEGTHLRVLGPDEDRDGTTWRHVATPDGAEGYIPASYTAPLGSPIVARATATSPSAPTTRSEGADAAKTRSLQAWIDQFGLPGYTPSWFGFIREVFVSGNTGVAVTSIADPTAQRSAVQGVCSGVSGWVNSIDGGRAQGVSRVEVRSANGRVLRARNSVSDPCQRDARPSGRYPSSWLNPRGRCAASYTRLLPLRAGEGGLWSCPTRVSAGG